MKTIILIAISCLIMTSVQSQKTPQGVGEFERELFVKKVQLMTWVKHSLKNQYYFVSIQETENQMQLFGEAKRFLALYGKNLNDAFIDLSNFCPGTDYHDFKQIEQGMMINQELFVLIHLYDDWVFQLNIGVSASSMSITKWKNNDWSQYDTVKNADEYEQGKEETKE
jgi:hypothetical protein